MTRRWPDTLPRGQQRGGYRVQPSPDGIRTDMDVPGASKTRRITRDTRYNVQLAMRMSDVEFAAYQAWYRDQTLYSLIGASDSVAAWAPTGVTVSAGSAVGHDGVLVDTLVETTGDSEHQIQYVIGSGVTGGQTLVCTAAFRPLNRTRARIALFGFDGGYRCADFDLSAGTVVLQFGGATATIKDLGGGWRRCQIVTPVGSGAAPLALQLLAMNGADISYVGSGTAALEVGGVQARVQTGYDLYLPTDATGAVKGAGGGTAWFSMPLALGGGVRNVETQMVEPFSAELASGLNWQLSGRVEVRNA